MVHSLSYLVLHCCLYSVFTVGVHSVLKELEHTCSYTVLYSVLYSVEHSSSWVVVHLGLDIVSYTVLYWGSNTHLHLRFPSSQPAGEAVIAPTKDTNSNDVNMMMI